MAGAGSSSGRRRASVAALAALLATVASTPAFADNSSATIYRCKQENGRLAYQDFPCAGGVVVEVRPGAPNPAAIARLEREQEAFERAAALRRADEQVALRREELTLRQRELNYAAAGGGSGADTGPYYVPAYGFDGFGGYADRHTRRDFKHDVRKRHDEPTRRVPAVIQRPQRR